MDTDTKLDTNFSDIKVDFLNNTHQLNNYNEIYSMNKHVDGIQNIERRKLEGINENLKTRIMKLKQEYMLIDYKRNALIMKSRIMMFSSVVIALCFILAALFLMEKINQTIMFSVIGVLCVIYLFVVIMIIKSNSHRRYYSWSQYYWAEMKKTNG